MKITITINTDNAAFEDDLVGEVIRIIGAAPIRKTVEQTTTGATRWEPLRDINGNTVGKIQVTP